MTVSTPNALRQSPSHFTALSMEKQWWWFVPLFLETCRQSVFLTVLCGYEWTSALGVSQIPGLMYLAQMGTCAFQWACFFFFFLPSSYVSMHTGFGRKITNASRHVLYTSKRYDILHLTPHHKSKQSLNVPNSVVVFLFSSSSPARKGDQDGTEKDHAFSTACATLPALPLDTSATPGRSLLAGASSQ